jgi:hypothetical protein
MFCLPYYAYVFSSTKLEIRTKQVLAGSEGGRGGKNGGGALEGEMTQTMYVHINNVNKWITKIF